MRRAAALAAIVAVAGCGGDSGERDTALVVSAAASLSGALRACAPGGARLSFGGSDELAAQIRQGVEPGVFAAANTTLPAQLHEDGLASRPRVFATNELVVAVRPESGLRRLEDLGRDGVTVAVGAPSVPVGAYTRDVLGRLPGAVRQAIEGNVRTREPDVRGVVGKIKQRAVDAGFVYATDAAAGSADGLDPDDPDAAGDGLRTIRLPRSLQPRVEYAAAVVAASEQAEAFLDDLVAGDCQQALRAGGFGAP